MSRENCLPYQENLVAYSLGALDAGEIMALESHLKTCDDCQSEMADYQEIATGLLNSVRDRIPPASLRRKLLTRLPSAQHRTSGLFARFFSQPSPGQFATAAVMVLLLGMNIFLALQIRELQGQQKALVERLSTEQAAIAMLAYPNTQVLAITADVQNLTGSILVDKDTTTAVLFLWNLPELTADQVYQIWLIDTNGNRVSAGLFSPASGQDYTTAFIQSSVVLKVFIHVGVTIEPRRGSTQPTSPPVLVVDL